MMSDGGKSWHEVMAGQIVEGLKGKESLGDAERVLLVAEIIRIYVSPKG